MRARVLYERCAALIPSVPVTYEQLVRWESVKGEMDVVKADLAVALNDQAVALGEAVELVAVLEAEPIVDAVASFEQESLDAAITQDLAVINDCLVWEQDGITFTLSEMEEMPEYDGICFHVEARDVNGPLPTDNPYQFMSPPLAKKVATYADGEDVFVEDADTHLENIKVMVSQAVLHVATQQGWTP